MYVDKKLGGVQCVQTLSRLNRTIRGKTQTFVLDFVNEPQDIQESFQRFYQSTILEGETDPNRLYDLLRNIYGFGLYSNEDVTQFCKIFFDPNREEGSLHPILDGVVDKFKLIEDEEIKEDFRSKVQSYIRLYGYLSQIITFTDIELEKSFVFLKFLNKKLPKRETGKLDISDMIDLDSLRIQKLHEHVEDLVPEDAILNPPELETTGVPEPTYDFLSEIINQVNNTYGVNLTEADKLDLSRLNRMLIENPKLKIYMNGNNTEDNKLNHFAKQFEVMLIDHINERFDFYKKLDDNPSMKRLIIQRMYKHYQNQRTQP